MDLDELKVRIHLMDDATLERELRGETAAVRFLPRYSSKHFLSSWRVVRKNDYRIKRPGLVRLSRALKPWLQVLGVEAYVTPVLAGLLLKPTGRTQVTLAISTSGSFIGQVFDYLPADRSSREDLYLAVMAVAHLEAPCSILSSSWK